MQTNLILQSFGTGGNTKLRNMSVLDELSQSSSHSSHSCQCCMFQTMLRLQVCTAPVSLALR